MSLYIKVYRRRRYLYYSFICLFFFGIIVFLSQSDIKTKTKIRTQKRAVVKSVIAMDNYLPPPACVGCPGENGAPVLLSVRYKDF